MMLANRSALINLFPPSLAGFYSDLVELVDFGVFASEASKFKLVRGALLLCGVSSFDSDGLSSTFISRCCAGFDSRIYFKLY
jgi:hypothetical protein